MTGTTTGGGYLRGPKVSLRPVESESDARGVFRMMNNPEAVGRFVNFDPMTWEAFQLAMRNWSNPPFSITLMIIERNEDQQLVGYGVYFLPYPSNPSCVELGSLIEAPEHRGKGYTTEALALGIEFLFGTKPIERIQATTAPGNVPVAKLLERAGFQREGVLRRAYFVDGEYQDKVMYGLIRSDWSRDVPKE